MDRYNLRVTVEINRLAENGAYTGERLSINQEYVLPVSGFQEIAEVLGRFQALAETVKREA
jgi:hypothetical protein